MIFLALFLMVDGTVTPDSVSVSSSPVAPLLELSVVSLHTALPGSITLALNPGEVSKPTVPFHAASKH
jgi:hypothetical protein